MNPGLWARPTPRGRLIGTLGPYAVPPFGRIEGWGGRQVTK